MTDLRWGPQKKRKTEKRFFLNGSWVQIFTSKLGVDVSQNTPNSLTISKTKTEPNPGITPAKK